MWWPSHTPAKLRYLAFCLVLRNILCILCNLSSCLVSYWLSITAPLLTSGSLQNRMHYNSRSCTSGQGRETHANAPKTCIYALVYTHLTENTRAREFVDFTRMLQQDIKTLEDHIWYETWIANEPIWAQHHICAHYRCCYSSGGGVCSAEQLVWQILLCENLRYREIISCGSGAADCVRNQFEISHLYVRMNSAKRDEDEDTETRSWKHVDGK